MLLLIDFEKAFDSIDFGFIITTFENFGFGKEFIKWITIKSLVKEGTHFKTLTVVIGKILSPLDMKRRCRKGDRIYSYLFILTIEILALLLTASKIKPYRTKHKMEHLLVLYADDLTLYFDFDKRNMI